MSDLKRKLKEEGQDIQPLKAPDGLENRLRDKLNAQQTKTRNKWKRPSLIAASLIFLLVFTYQFNSMAYYGKKILGYDKVLTESLSELNEEGRGQVIDKIAKLPNGVEVTVDGLMLDDTQLLVMYTVRDPRENVRDKFSDFRVSLSGFLGEIHPESGRGNTNEDQTELKFIQSFEPPNPLVKSLEFHLVMDGHPNQTVTIPFKLNRSKAMMSKFELDLDKKIKTDTAVYDFKELIATPTQTVIRGEIKVTDRKAWDEVTVGAATFKVGLRADGETIPMGGAGMSSGIGGYTFDLQFEPITDDVDNLELTLQRELKIHNTKSEANIEEGHIQLNELVLPFEDVNVRDGKTEVTLSTPYEFSILKVSLKGDGASIKLIDTYNKSFNKTKDGLEKQMVLVFDGTVEGEKILTITKYVNVEDTNKSIHFKVN